MLSLNAIPRASVYVRLILTVAVAVLLLFLILKRGVAPSSVLSVMRVETILSTHPAIWIMVATGLTGFFLGSWIWILRPKSLPALFFGLSGIATLTFTFSPLLFFATTPVSQDTAAILDRLNMYGASMFGAVTCALLLIYPTKLPFHKILVPLVLIGFGVWTVWAAWDLANIGYFVQLITLSEMLGIIALSIWQIMESRNEADKRAVAIWLSACVIVGSAPFIALVAAPAVLGREGLMPPFYAFAFFNIVYVGFAVGLLRLRIFELGRWAFQIVFHAGLAILFIVMDIVLVSSLAIQSGTALTFTALILAVLYLPLRGWLWTRFNGKGVSEAEMFQSVIETGLKPSGEQRAQSWVGLLRRTFKPVDIALGPAGEQAVTVASDGLSLTLPAAIDAPALILHHKNEGRSLFGPKDQTLAAQLLRLIQQVDGSRQAYDRGVREERSRIGQDIHDNIGAQLLQALHSNKAGRKDAMIRESLSDLRDVINNASKDEVSLTDMLADLRAETSERAENHGLTLRWQAAGLDEIKLNGDQLHAMRSVLREAVTNVLKHSGARELGITFEGRDGSLKLTIEDDGKGFAQANQTSPSGGNGLKNMRDRIERNGGALAVESSASGTCIAAQFPAEITA